MDIKTVTAITEFIIKFAKYYNLAESDGTSTTALVVSFQYLNRRLKFCMQKEYSEMLKHYSELFDFLMKRRQNVYDKKLDTKWTYRIIHGKKYDKNDLYKEKILLPLKNSKFYNFSLLVFYQEPTMLEYYGIKEEYYTLIEKLAKGIEICFEVEENTLNQCLTFLSNLFKLYRKTLLLKKNTYI